MPAVSVSDCDQYITFSSDAATNTDSCSATEEKAAAVGESATPLGAASVTTVPTQPPLAVTATGTAAMAGATYDAAVVTPGTYYAAPWHNVAKGGVPSLVKAEICSLLPSQTDSVGCVTASESWSISTLMIPGTSVATRSFEGVSVLHFILKSVYMLTYNSLW